MYGHAWGEGAARCFRVDGDFDDAAGARLSPIPECFICPLTTTVMNDPVMTSDGCVYEREYIEHWIRTRRQQHKPVTSPSTNQELVFTQLVPLLALKKAIEAYMKCRPELQKMPMEKKSLQAAAVCLQEDLQVKEAQRRNLRDERDALKLQVAEMRIRIARLESEQDRLQNHITEKCGDEGPVHMAFPRAAAIRATSARAPPLLQAGFFPNPPRASGSSRSSLWAENPFITSDRAPRDRSSSPGKGEHAFIQYSMDPKHNADDDLIGSTLLAAFQSVFSSPTACCARNADKGG